MLVLNVTPDFFFDGADLNTVFFAKHVRFTFAGNTTLYTVAKAKLVGQSLVVTKCQCVVNEYTDTLLVLNEADSPDDAVAKAINSIQQLRKDLECLGCKDAI